MMNINTIVAQLRDFWLSTGMKKIRNRATRGIPYTIYKSWLLFFFPPLPLSRTLIFAHQASIVIYLFFPIWEVKAKSGEAEE